MFLNRSGKLKLIGFFSLLPLSLANGEGYEPKNRFFSVESPVERPDLECMVGVDSMATSELYRVKCTEAWNISVKIDQKKANEMHASHYISDQDRIRRTIRFGIQGSGLRFEAAHYWANWTAPVNNWVCGYYPVLSTVIFDCLPENQVADWWKTPLMGPAFSSGMIGAAKAGKMPGCNGGVCYCNDENFCNDRNDITKDTECPDHLDHKKWDLRCQTSQNP